MFKNAWQRMIRDNKAKFEEEDALEDEMAESEKEEKVEDVYEFQGKETTSQVKAFPRRSPRVQYAEAQESVSPSAEESGDNYDYGIIDTFIGRQGFSQVDADITKDEVRKGTSETNTFNRVRYLYDVCVCTLRG